VSNSNRVFDGYLKVDRYELSHELYCGDWSQTLVREVMDRGEVAAILPFDPIRQEVVLIEQFRVGAWAASWQEPWLLECVAGVMHEGESAGEVAIREAREETGCEVTDLGIGLPLLLIVRGLHRTGGLVLRARGCFDS
jgi:ADP-ribose pyrophosphatase